MKLTIDLDLDDFYEYGEGASLKEVIVSEAARQAALWLYGDETEIERYGSALKNNNDTILKENQDKIIQTVIDNVEKKVLAKKRIKDEMPKAAAISALNKENEGYFMTLIDRAIAKRFK